MEYLGAFWSRMETLSCFIEDCLSERVVYNETNAFLHVLGEFMKLEPGIGLVARLFQLFRAAKKVPSSSATGTLACFFITGCLIILFNFAQTEEPDVRGITNVNRST